MSTLEQLQLIESIVEESPAIIFRWIISADWPVEYVSRNIILLGYTQEEMMNGTISWPDITHPGDLDRLEKEVGDFLSSGANRWSQTYRIRARDGSYRWMRDWNLVLFDDRGAPCKIQGIVIDITSEKTAERERLEIEMKLQDTLTHVISGFIPICSDCKSIRDIAGNWNPVEEYIHHKSPVKFTHGICPACLKKRTRDLDKSSGEFDGT